MLPRVPEEYRLSLNEGDTPLAEKNGLFFKCEYENPTGSIKDRGLCFQISRLFERKIKKAVISSSGNAGISAAAYCRLAGIDLTVFVSPKINITKLDILKKQAEVVITPRPVSSAFQTALWDKAHNLRQSTDTEAPVGFETVSFELTESAGIPDDIFLPVSSGTAMKGIYDGFKKSGRLPRFHAVQTSRINPLAAHFDHDFTPETESLAEGIVARSLPREKELLHIIRDSSGSGWVIQNLQMEEAKTELDRLGFETSFEGAAAYAAVKKAQVSGFRLGRTVVILTGKHYG
ncbi:MAG: threonine synthase, threonine synthase [Candidatus Gottesmanbacteria bacterium GW2011_GWA2_43_14]|uniref:Threonine synthase, threonine synthase n=1 Tax=Candidatus Gottesmanbacteria bacterium GW2011_GWA2_43_14 TaxID=1618443 RepID=A0A0G1DM53_9BACT|nr:MAG: threonine synthase, threonine synthase [Candidatus Gottesmanbacteria bacterium GW2011_GWA2_43_14]